MPGQGHRFRMPVGVGNLRWTSSTQIHAARSSRLRRQPASAICYRRTGPAIEHSGAPANRQTTVGKRVDGAVFTPHTVAQRSAPLRPVVGLQNGRRNQ